MGICIVDFYFISIHVRLQEIHSLVTSMHSLTLLTFSNLLLHFCILAPILDQISGINVSSITCIVPYNQKSAIVSYKTTNSLYWMVSIMTSFQGLSAQSIVKSRILCTDIVLTAGLAYIQASYFMRTVYTTSNNYLLKVLEYIRRWRLLHVVTFENRKLSVHVDSRRCTNELKCLS